MPIYTKKGDAGITDLCDGERVAKDDLFIEFLGQLDELNCAIGIVVAFLDRREKNHAILFRVQHELFILDAAINKNNDVDKSLVEQLENDIDELNVSLPELNQFIIPGENKVSAFCHFARAVCRRTERCLVTLSHQHDIGPNVLAYMNRLSDLLFVIARQTSHPVV